jgi:5-formyltetrahydrofolate cyclo-ligase
MLIDNCLKRQVRTVLPRVDKKEGKLLLYRIISTAELVSGPFGIPEPDGTEKMPLLPSEMDFVVVPGVAFDAAGSRIGYGKGYYDRLLAGLNVPTAGLCFEEQLVEHIPCEPHDRRVTMIITEKRIIHCHGYQKN